MDSEPTGKETKNMTIENAIRRLSISVDTLQDVGTRIKEENPPKAAKESTPEPLPSLEMTLDIAAPKIDAIRDRIQKIIDEISPPMGVTMGQVFDGIVGDNLAWLKESNPEIVFYEMPPEEKARWAEVITPFWGEWVSDVEALGYPGQEMLDDWISFCKKYE